jgi:hypothetical protein
MTPFTRMITPNAMTTSERIAAICARRGEVVSVRKGGTWDGRATTMPVDLIRED